MMMEMLISHLDFQKPRRLLLKSSESSTVRTSPSKTLRTLLLTRLSQSLLLSFNSIQRNLMLMVYSNLWMPTSPEETSRTLSPTSHLQSLLVLPKLDPRDSQLRLTQNLPSMKTLKLPPTLDLSISQLDLTRLTSSEPRLMPNSCQLLHRTDHKTSLLLREMETSLSSLKLAPSSCQSLHRTNHKTSLLLRETETNLSSPKPQLSQLTHQLFKLPPQETSILLTKKPSTLLLSKPAK